MSKEVYYKALNQLIDTGYLKVGKAQDFLNKNVYIINNSPNHIISEATLVNNTEKSTLSHEGVKSHGFGVIPKAIMCDKALTINAKALLAYFYSLAASGACAFPDRSVILTSLCISKSTYYDALNLIVERGYVTIKSRRSQNGRFTINNYILMDNPQPCPKNPDNGKNEANTKVSPCPKNPDNENNRVLKNQTIPCPKNPDNNSIIFNSKLNNSTSNLNVSTTLKDSVGVQDEIKDLAKYAYYKNKIPELERSTNLQVQSIAKELRLYLRVVNALCDMCTIKRPQSYNQQIVTSQEIYIALKECVVDSNICSLIEGIVAHYINCANTYIIKNPKEYIKPIIWQHIQNFGFDTDRWWEAG